MMDEPTIERLIGAAAGFLREVGPRLEPRDAFLARVSVNALELVLRDLEGRPAMELRARERLLSLVGEGPGAVTDLDALTVELVRRIRSGDFDGAPSAALLRHLAETAADQVRIDQPGYSGLRTSGRVTG